MNIIIAFTKMDLLLTMEFL